MRQPTSYEEYRERRRQEEMKLKFINDIISEVTVSETNRIDELRKKCVEEHVKLTNTDGFYMGGKIFTNVQNAPFSILQKTVCHQSVRKDAENYLKQLKELHEDQSRIRQGLTILLSKVSSRQDMRDALPDVLLQFVKNPEITSLPRTREAAYTVTSKLHLSQLEKTLDRVYFYMGSRLIG